VPSLPTPDRLPPGLYALDGAPRPRRWGWVFAFNDLDCARGHRLSFSRNVREDGFLECARCGAVLYVYVPPAFGERRRAWAADVTPAERDHFNDRGLTPADVIEYVGGTFPPARRRPAHPGNAASN
jgi:hypothetical protein